MPPSPKLERLVRSVREFPGPGTRVAGLRAAASILERQLEIARAIEIQALNESHEAEATYLHPDDRDLDLYELEQRVTHLLPRVLRGGFILVMWSTLESCVRDILEYAYGKRGKLFNERVLRGKSPVASASKALAEELQVPVSIEPQVLDDLERLRQVRHVLVHRDAELSALQRNLGITDQRGIELLGLYVENDIHHNYVVPTSEFVERNVSVIDSYLVSLAKQVFDSLDPPVRE